MGFDDLEMEGTYRYMSDKSPVSYEVVNHIDINYNGCNTAVQQVEVIVIYLGFVMALWV